MRPPSPGQRPHAPSSTPRGPAHPARHVGPQGAWPEGSMEHLDVVESVDAGCSPRAAQGKAFGDCLVTWTMAGRWWGRQPQGALLKHCAPQPAPPATSTASCRKLWACGLSVASCVQVWTAGTGRAVLQDGGPCLLCHPCAAPPQAGVCPPQFSVSSPLSLGFLGPPSMTTGPQARILPRHRPVPPQPGHV